jgi:hypothetical protein
MAVLSGVKSSHRWLRGHSDIENVQYLPFAACRAVAKPSDVRLAEAGGMAEWSMAVVLKN